MNLVQLLLKRILIMVTWRPALTIVLAFALAGLSSFYTVRNLGFETSQRDLISPEHHLVQLAETVDQFDDVDNFIVTIENSSSSRSLDFLRSLVVKLESDKEHVAEVFYRIDPDALRKWALLYPDRKDLLTLHDKLQEHQDFIRDLASSPELTNFFQLINNEIASAMVGELFTGFLNDDEGKDEEEPFDLNFLINSLKSMNLFLEGAPFKSPWGSLFADGSWEEETEGYFWTENQRYLLVFVTPVEKGEGFNNAQEALEALRATVAGVRRDFPDIQAGVTGREAMNVDEMTSSFEDMSVATIISLVGLALLLTLFWRGVRRPLFQMTNSVTALALTFGLTTLVIGHLNILSIVFAPLMVGLGDDYGVHWLSRYREEVKGSRSSRKAAIQATMVKLGPGIMLAGLTAALSFFPLVLTGFKGLAELGIISSMGMIVTTFTTLFVLPALTLMFDKPKPQEQITHADGRALFPMTNRRAIGIFVFSAAALIISSIAATGVTFDLNLLNLQSKDAESIIWEKKMLEDSKRSSMYGAVLAHSLDEVSAKSKLLEALPTVSKVESVQTILPQDQREKIQILRQIKPFIPDPASFRASGKPVSVGELDKTLSRIRFKMLDSSKSEWGDRTPLDEQMGQVRDLIGRIRYSFKTLDEAKLQTVLQDYDTHLMNDLNDKLDLMQANANASPMQISDLPADILDRFVGQNGVYLIRVFPEEDIWEPKLLGKFVADLTSVDAEAVGDPVTLYVFTKAFRDACIKASVYAVIFISFLLFLTFRSLSNMVMAMLPLLVGTAYTMGLMRVFGVNLNLANSLFLPLIVGAGVEYGIIIMQRWLQHNSGGVELPFSTGKGVILAALTTTVGFGSLTIASHRGISSLGLLATIGSLSVVAAAVILLPAVLRLETMVREKLACRRVREARVRDKCVALEEKQI